jgi:hypothetical protein
MTCDYAYMEGYELQPTKSVVLNITHKQCKQEHNNLTFTLGPNKMPTVESATHLGIIRTTSLHKVVMIVFALGFFSGNFQEVTESLLLVV